MRNQGSGKHWTEQEITEWLYGVREDASHLEECAVCRDQAAQAKNIRRAMLGATPEVPADLLAAQRRSLYDRMERGNSWLGQPRFRWAASLALVLLVAVMSFNLLHRTAYLPLATPADERLYSDMVAIDQSSEPRAIQPIQKLFEE